jgi:hypothetical protein
MNEHISLGDAIVIVLLVVIIVPMILVYFWLLGSALIRALSRELGWMHMEGQHG